MTPTIYLSKNGMLITPYRKGQCRDLENFTSMWDEVYYKRIELTGFFIDQFQGDAAFIGPKQSAEFLAANFSRYEIIKRKVATPYPMEKRYSLNKNVHLRPIQTSIMQKIITSRKSAYNEWFVHLQTGLGKTVLASYLSVSFGLKTMITCFSTTVLSQWIATYQQKTNVPAEKILYINSGKILTRIIEHKLDPQDYDIYICTPGILTEFASKYDYAYLTEIFDYLGIGLLIYDEAHRNMGNISKINALTNVKNTLYLSADYGQGDPFKEKMYLNVIRNAEVIEPEIEEKYETRNTKILVVDYDSQPNSIEKESIYNRYGFSSQYYMEYQLNRGIIFDVVSFIVDTIKKTDTEFRTLILVTRIDHVDRMWNYLKTKYPQYTIGRYHSMLDSEEKEFTLTTANIIVSTYQSFGTGVDTPDIKYVIGLNQSNKVEDNQAAGRARPPKDGSSPMYFIVVDKGFRYCSKKLRTRLAYLKDNKSNVNPFVYHFYTGVDPLK